MERTSGIAIMGATATGKSSVALAVAERVGGEIISMDSRQVYRGLDIGTAKDAAAARARVPHHLVDILMPDDVHSAGRHVALARKVAQDVESRGRVPFFVGGTGLYFRVLFEGLIDAPMGQAESNAIRDHMAGKSTDVLYGELSAVDPARARDLSGNDRVRIMRALAIYHATGRTFTEHRQRQQAPTWHGLRFVLTMPRAILRERIAQRTREMYAAGWVAEVRGLLRGGCRFDSPAMGSLGYRAIADALIRGDDPDRTVDSVIRLTQQYAKRQETFFRAIPDAHWIDVTACDPVAEVSHSVDNTPWA